MSDRPDRGAVNRRVLLRAIGTGAAVTALGATPSAASAASLPAGLFALGVASGDPRADSVVLWTRLAPDPRATRGGMPDAPVTVTWELATDQAFTTGLRSGTVVAQTEDAHSVHAVVAGLAPATVYWYRFRVDGQTSRTGRTKTLPAAGAAVASFRFAVACCQQFQSGYFSAHWHLAVEDIDAVVFLGDYIYDNPPVNYDGVPDSRIHWTGTPTDLSGYRNRYSQYKLDPALQQAHAAVPWIVVYDDHELHDNWAGSTASTTERARLVAAFKAYWEHMPLRPETLDRVTGALDVTRALTIGDLGVLWLLDTRQFRDAEARTHDEAWATGRSMLGSAQYSWLTTGLAGAGRSVTWNVLASSVMVSPVRRMADPAGYGENLDCWDGYGKERHQLLDFLHDNAIPNPVVVSGDQHESWVSNVKPVFHDDASPVVAAEVTATSITSGQQVSSAKRGEFAGNLARNRASAFPWVQDATVNRGYLVCELTPSEFGVALRSVSSINVEHATLSTFGRYRVLAGVPGIHRS